MCILTNTTQGLIQLKGMSDVFGGIQKVRDMTNRDIFQSVNDLGPEAIQKIVDRLEYRGRDPAFVRMRETYLEMGLNPNARVLDCGCGTGVVSRAIVKRDGFAGTVVGVDFSGELIAAAKRLAQEEGLIDRIDLRVGDLHALDEPDDSYDFVIAHTLISHVADPAKVITEMSRVVRPNGTIAIFDGDYASLTFGAGDPKRDATMVDTLRSIAVANPYVMRQVPALLRDCNLEIVAFLPAIHAEAGEGAFFANIAESYISMVVAAGTVTSEDANDWLLMLRKASREKTFFGACSYYTYLVRKRVVQ